MGDIVFEDVWKVFRNGTTALRSLNLEVHEGEFFVILGPSGCGKTTMLRTAAGLEFPTSGRIYIAGRDVTELAPKQRNVAMVFQNYSLYPHMTVFENMAFGVQAKKLKKPEVEALVNRVAAILDLEDVLKKKPHSLSGGQQQRVAMGRAIVREPQAFLMDEPLSNVDARARIQIRGEIARIQRDLGITTLYVTHDQNEAMVLGDRVGVLREGSIEQVSTPGGLYRSPDNLFVAGFVGAPPMNLAEATVEEAADGLFIRFSGHRLRVDDSSHDGVSTYAWRQVVVGVRPEDLGEAPSLGAPGDSRLRVVVSRREEIGADVYLFFTVSAPLLLAEDPRDADIDDDVERTWPAERRNEWMIRLDSSSAREGDTVELAVRPGRMYLFDPRSGNVIG
jgi:multiple sugar transport system ATP-binding protein